jgi:DNA repair protein RadC
MEAKKINRLGFKFTEEINLISLLKENSSLAFDLPEPQKEKVRVLRELVQEYYTSIDIAKHITLDSPEMVLKSMYPIMKGLEHKEYWVIFTNRRHTHIKTIRHTIGSHESLLDVRIILRQALELNATGIILVSNSVDGSVEPTLRDIEYTKKLHKAAGLLDIYLTDHVIISASSYHSITDHQTSEITPSLLHTLQK